MPAEEGSKLRLGGAGCPTAILSPRLWPGAAVAVSPSQAGRGLPERA